LLPPQRHLREEAGGADMRRDKRSTINTVQAAPQSLLHTGLCEQKRTHNPIPATAASHRFAGVRNEHREKTPKRWQLLHQRACQPVDVLLAVATLVETAITGWPGWKGRCYDCCRLRRRRHGSARRCARPFIDCVVALRSFRHIQRRHSLAGGEAGFAAGASARAGALAAVLMHDQ